ncbi:hypothetical protein [Brevibacterium album]|uniref:PH-like domain-containing protein n=1 Tax=Brevibacterium album TaxID=417948 RepID=UPI0003F8AA4F|nr:hypothetical protein [Brevibacterium album]
MERLIPTLVLLGVAGLVFAGMWWGWRRRSRAQQGLPAPPAPVEGSEVLAAPVEGMYVATTTAGDPYDRIAAHGLGLRTQALVVATAAGLVIERSGTRDLLLPWEAITGVRAGQGMIGKFVEPAGLVIVGWRLGDTEVETGFRTRAAALRTPLIETIRRLHQEER